MNLERKRDYIIPGRIDIQCEILPVPFEKLSGMAMRRQYPQFFQRARSIQIGERHYEGYGNLFLQCNPDKEAVKISRKDSLLIFECYGLHPFLYFYVFLYSPLV